MASERNEARTGRQVSTFAKPTIGQAPIIQKSLESPRDLVSSHQSDRWQRLLNTNHQEAFANIVNQINDLVSQCEPIATLSVLSAYFLFGSPGVNPEFTEADPTLQFHVEWLQGYLLRSELSSYADTGDLRLVARNTPRLLKEIPILATLDRWQRDLAKRQEGETQGSQQQELARSERIALRNWGYPDQMFDLAEDLARTFDSHCPPYGRYPLQAVAPLMKNIVLEIERRFREARTTNLNILKKSSSAEGMIKRWQDSSLPFGACAQSLEYAIAHGSVDSTEILDCFFHTIETDFRRIFTFTIDQIVQLGCGFFTPGDIQSLLQDTGLHFGDLSGTPIDHLTMGNPVWRKPFILGERAIYCPIPGMLISHLFDLMEPLAVSRCAEAWWLSRSKFLEDEVEYLIREAFPAGMVATKLKWSPPEDKSVVYENDVVLVYEDLLLVAEAKSHRVPAAVRRGAPEGLYESIQKMVIEPSTQSERFVNRLIQFPEQRTFESSNSTQVTLPISSINVPVRINVVLDSFALVSNTLTSLRESGLVQDDVKELSATFLLSDLQTIFNVLPDELQRAHYIARRALICNRLQIQADEIELLALYLATDGGWSQLTNDATPIIVHGLANTIDASIESFYGTNNRSLLPLRKFTKAWERSLDLLRREKPENWINAGFVLLDADFAQQLEIERSVKNMIRALNPNTETTRYAISAKSVGSDLWGGLVISVVSKGPQDKINESRDELDQLVSSQGLDTVILYFDSNRGPYRPTEIALRSVSYP